ncbi:MAG TPA: hypothetical protein VKI65_09910 [Gemmataceae bacterium]|nr:hypothetical protein [Gemmataceae bacterium]
MPIRFRCGNCNQLLGISRKKVGTRVRCPTCATEVTVPSPEAAQVHKESEHASGDDGGPSPLFERSDFGNLFEAVVAPAPPPPIRGVAAGAAPLGASAGAPAESKPGSEFAFDVEPVDAAAVAAPRSAIARQQGILLTPTWATVLAVVAIILLAIAFGLGLGIGYFIFHSARPAPEGDASARVATVQWRDHILAAKVAM